MRKKITKLIYRFLKPYIELEVEKSKITFDVWARIKIFGVKVEEVRFSELERMSKL